MELNDQKKKLTDDLNVAQDASKQSEAIAHARIRELEARYEASMRSTHALQLERDASQQEFSITRQRLEKQTVEHVEALARQMQQTQQLEKDLELAVRTRLAMENEQKAAAARYAAEVVRAEEALLAERAVTCQMRDKLASVAAAAHAAEIEAQIQKTEMTRNKEAITTQLTALQQQLAIVAADNERLHAAAAMAARQASEWEPLRDTYELQLSQARQTLINKENECFSLDQHLAALQQQLAERAQQVRKLEAQLERPRRQQQLSQGTHEKSSKHPLSSPYYGLGTVLSAAGGWLIAATRMSGRELLLRRGDVTVLPEDPLPHAESLLQLNTLGPVLKAQRVATTSLCLLVQVRVSARSKHAQLAAAREVVLLSRLTHPNLISLDGVLREPLLDGWQLSLVLSPFVSDTLEQTIRTFRFEQRDIQALFQQVLSLLTYLHAANVVVRTLHSSMFLFVKQSASLKLLSLCTARSLHSAPFDPLPSHTVSELNVEAGYYIEEMCN